MTHVPTTLTDAAIFPANIALQAAVPPVADAEWWVGEDEVSTQIWVLVAREGICGFFAQVEVNDANGEVHRRQAPGGWVGFLAVDRDVANLAAMGLDELLGLHEHPA